MCSRIAGFQPWPGPTDFEYKGGWPCVPPEGMGLGYEGCRTGAMGTEPGML